MSRTDERYKSTDDKSEKSIQLVAQTGNKLEGKRNEKLRHMEELISNII